MTDQVHDLPLQRTPLHDLHVRFGARMIPFAGYDLPFVPHRYKPI